MQHGAWPGFLSVNRVRGSQLSYYLRRLGTGRGCCPDLLSELLESPHPIGSGLLICLDSILMG